MKIEQFSFSNSTVLHPEDAAGIANSVEPDQTASVATLLTLVCSNTRTFYGTRLQDTTLILITFTFVYRKSFMLLMSKQVRK